MNPIAMGRRFSVRLQHHPDRRAGVVADLTDEQVSPTQILVLPVVPLPGRADESGRPDPDGILPAPDRTFRKRHLLSDARLSFRTHFPNLSRPALRAN